MDIIETARRLAAARAEFEMLKRRIEREVEGAEDEILRAAGRVAWRKPRRSDDDETGNF